MKFQTVSIRSTDANYPRLLKEISHPPSPLYTKGFLHPTLPLIAIVGTRKATTQGLAFAKCLASELASTHIGVVSGLALGVDGAAHEGALSANGYTIAVLPSHLQSVYPRQHAQLAHRILTSRGALLSEYPSDPAQPPYKNNFLERNRIVSGLCLGVVIVEAPLRSGTLATARFAANQGREVFVVPGPAQHPNYAGSHELIRNGARLVTSAHDIIDDLSISLPSPDSSATSASGQLSQLSQSILDILRSSRNGLTTQDIIDHTGLKAHIVHSELTLLTLSGIIRDTGDGFTIS